jgi:hypothetical protein
VQLAYCRNPDQGSVRFFLENIEGIVHRSTSLGWDGAQATRSEIEGYIGNFSGRKRLRAHQPLSVCALLN